jgi:hypothetical protein
MIRSCRGVHLSLTGSAHLRVQVEIWERLMRIEARPGLPVGRASGGRSASAATFAPGEARERPAAREIAPGFGLAALVAAEEAGDAPARRRQAAARGFRLIDDLEGLKLELLMGRVPRARLARLAAELAARGEADDPALAGLVREIEVRVAVELAKLGH